MSGVGPGLLERGDQLRVLGAGFPAGHAGTLELQGMVHSPAAAPSSLRVALVAQVVAADRVEVSLGQAAAQRLPVHGSFDGSLTLRFAGAQGDTQVVGRLPSVHLDWVGALPITQERELRARALQWLQRAGIAPLDTDSARDGVVIAQVQQDGPAQRAGFAVGDLLQSAAGVRVHSLLDLAPVPDAHNVALQVSRGGQSLQLVLDASAAVVNAAVLPAREQQLVLLLVACVVCGLFLGPFTSPSTWLARWRSRYRMLGARPAVFGELAGAAGAQHSVVARLQAAAVPVVCSVLAFAFALLGASARAQVDAASLLLGYFALVAVAYVRQPRRLLVLGAHAGMLALVVACVAVTAGTRTLASLVAAQGAYPWTFSVFTRPQLSLGFVLFLAHGARLLAGLSSTRRSSAALALDVSGRCLLASSAAALFLGGWNVPYLGVSAFASSVLGGVLFVAKTWLAAWLLGLSRALALGGLRRAWRAWVASFAMLLGTAAWLLFPPSEALERGLGPALFAIFACTALIAVLQVERAAGRLGQQPSHPAPFA
ncbi:MAG TPA: PDZ domain-containing protein [Polyangiales bacterium]